MACTYCGANITIPDHLRVKEKPRPEKISATPLQVEIPKIDASETLRKVQPVAVRAWNLYAYWTWLRRILPACLIILVIGIILCLALGLLPAIWIANL